MHKLLFLLVVSTFTLAQAQQPIQLIPQPVAVERLTGSFTLSSEATICFSAPECRPIAEMLAMKLNRPTGFALKPVHGLAGTIQLIVNTMSVPTLGAEGYTLEVSANGVRISANQTAGLYYGMQTLFQLMPKEIEALTVTKAQWTLPCVQITDYPRFAWRGVMLDVARHFFSKEDVERYIDEISRYKYNIFHWHLTDDQGWRIDIKALPKLTSVGAWRVPRVGRFGERAAPKPGEAATDGGFYTQDDIRDIIRFARDRNVTIIPEIDIPGHSMAAVASYPEVSCRKDTNTRVDPGMHIAEWYGNGTFKILYENTFNPSDEKVYEFLDKVFTEVAALFPGAYIHVGGDECYKGYWARDPGCIALMKKLHTHHVEDLQGYFMNRVEKIITSKGKKLLGWDELLDGDISPEATLMSWRGMKRGIEAATLGHDVVMTPTAFTYIDYTQGDQSVDPPIYESLRAKKCYSFEPVPDGMEATHILGGQANLWTEQVPTLRAAEYMTYPRAWALSEVYWSPKAAKSWNAFVPRMEAHFERADVAQINHSNAVYDAIVLTSVKNDVLTLVMEAEIPGLEIYYSIDESMPDNRSIKYTQPVVLPDGPITLRVVSYRNGAPIGHLITLNRDELLKRAGG
jgi:hexosaminidase